MSFADYYTEKATYTKVSRGRLNGIVKLIGDPENKIILDVGCGTGEVGRVVKDRFSGVKVFGIDVSQNAVTEAKKVLDDAYVCNLEENELPIEITGRHYDAVVLSEVLEHLLQPEHLLKDCVSLKISPFFSKETFYSRMCSNRWLICSL